MECRDETIKSDVVEALSRDSRVNSARITVDVDNCHVTLSGDAPTLFAIQAALDLVLSVHGVRTIHNNLEVYAGQQRLSDEEVQRCTQQVLRWNVSLNTSPLTVSVLHGSVTVKGEVDAYWKRGHAEYLVRDLQGVVAVTNEVLVKPALAPEDQVIRDDVKMAIARCSCTGDDAIDVEVNKGQVVLSGKVTSLWSKHMTPHVVESILGVKGVTDKLTVAGTT